MVVGGNVCFWATKKKVLGILQRYFWKKKRHKVTICRREKKVQIKTIVSRMFPAVFHKHWTLLYELYPNLARSSRPLPDDRQPTCLTDLDEPNPGKWAGCPGAWGPTGEICKVLRTWFEEQLSAPYDSVTCRADTWKSVEKTNASELLIAHKADPMLGTIYYFICVRWQS
jgi:hypothetical protein